MLSVIAKIPIKEEKMTEVLELFKQLMAEVAKEEGTLFYTLNTSKSEPNTLVVMERYRDEAALTAHSASPHLNAFMAQARKLFSDRPEIVFMNELSSIREGEQP
jgi:quinol monooxygenase YgiN